MTTRKVKYERTATLKRFIANFSLTDNGGMRAYKELRVEIEDINNHQHIGATKYVTVHRLVNRSVGIQKALAKLGNRSMLKA